VSAVNDDERVVRSAWRRLGGDEATIDRVVAAHQEPHRHYHTVTHVASVLRCAEELITAHPAAHADAVRVASIFHDVVYDPRAADNESRSAELAVETTASLGWTADEAGLVRRLILATADHEPEGLDEAVLLDADLSILGAQPDTYTAYVRGVRAEYGHVDDEAWRAGRSLVLQRFLDRPHVYATDTMRQTAERQARLNLAAELAGLAR